MARKVEVKEIDGIQFEVTQLDPKKSQRLLIRVLGHLSHVVGKAAAGISGDPEQGLSLATMDVDLSKVGAAIPALFERLTPDEFEAIQKELLTYARAQRPGADWVQLWPAFDLIMGEEPANPFTGFKVALFAFEVNFGNFSGVLAEHAQRLLAQRGRARQSGSPVQSVKTGTSGG
jgi:hypothetical protein